jgi:hypothetical protein
MALRFWICGYRSPTRILFRALPGLGGRYHSVPIQPKPLQKLSQSTRVVDGPALRATRAKQCPARIRDRAATAADLSHSSVLVHGRASGRQSARRAKVTSFSAVPGEHTDERPGRRRTSAPNVEAEHVLLDLRSWSTMSRPEVRRRRPGRASYRGALSTERSKSAASAPSAPA